LTDVIQGEKSTKSDLLPHKLFTYTILMISQELKYFCTRITTNQLYFSGGYCFCYPAEELFL